MDIKRLASAVLVAGATAGACAVHQTEEPPLAGPSDLATSVNVTATPDTLKLGMYPTSSGESAQVIVQIFGPDGQPSRNRQVRLDITVGNNFADCGQLSLRDLVTGSDGRAAAVYTAPTQPLPQPECTNLVPGGTVGIVATPVGTNFETSTQRTATIRMVLPTVIPAPGAPTVSFTISPATAAVGAEISFSDAGSYGAPGRTIVSYRWDFSDGITKNGAFVQHDFAAAGTYTATLTVTDDIGNQSSKSATVTITP
jgi:hypothetical protein